MKDQLRIRWGRGVLGAWALLAAVAVWAAEPGALTLEQALASARERNGNVAAARLGVEAARGQIRINRAAFLPELSPTYRYDTGTTDFVTGSSLGGGTSSKSQSSTLDVTATYVFLDNGTRRARVDASSLSARAQDADARDTLRQTLFAVHRQYYDVLRTTELLRVQQAQLTRSETILRQTEARVEVGDAARKDILQARADALNARAAVLTSTNAVTTSRATLKGTIAWQPDQDLPPLAPVALDLDGPMMAAPPETLAQAVTRGLERRPDLVAARLRLEAAGVDVRLARLDAGVAFSVEGSAGRQFSRDTTDRTNIGLFATIPLYDGRRSREAIAVRERTQDAQRERYIQSERTARAEIETAYQAVAQNIDRVRAASLAFEAARLNYEAALESQRAGAGSLLEVITAQVSLVTAESNLVQAQYDTLTAQVQLRLVLGDPIPGETP